MSMANIRASESLNTLSSTEHLFSWRRQNTRDIRVVEGVCLFELNCWHPISKAGAHEYQCNILAEANICNLLPALMSAT